MPESLRTKARPVDTQTASISALLEAVERDPELRQFVRSLPTAPRREFAHLLGNLNFSRRQIARLTGVSAKTIHYDIQGHEGVTPDGPDGRITWPLWIEALLRRAETGERREPIAAGRGSPGSEPLEALLWHQRQCERPHVGVGQRFGPRLPQLREPAERAPALEDLDEAMRQLHRQRAPWAQPGFPSDLWSDEAQRRLAVFTPWTARNTPAKRWRPFANDAICMWASSSRRLHGESVEQLRETLDPWWRAPLEQQLCDRTVRACIASGDALWTELGAWPWAAFTERISQDWWCDERAWLSITAWFPMDLRPPGLEAACERR